MEKKRLNTLIFVILLLGILSLFLEYGIPKSRLTGLIIVMLDFSVLALFLLDVILNFIQAEIKTKFLKNNLFDIIVLFILVLIFIYNRYISFLMKSQDLEVLSRNIIIIRNIFLLIKIFSRVRKLNYFLKKIASHPAQTIIFSFMSVIILGAILLMMPFSSADKSHLGILNALFTSTSAVCVTGLIVVDTAGKFSVYGKLIIMFLIQIGGLGIMILSYFSGFMMGKKYSLEDKMIMSYMLNEQEMKNLSKTLLNIIIITITIELAGAALLFNFFKGILGFNMKAVFYSIFHSISAFCNAGFALFSDSFESFKSDALLTLTISFLIIMGGLSFNVINNLIKNLSSNLKRKIFQRPVDLVKINLNTRVVLIVTALLIVSGMLIIYGFELKNSLVPFDLKTGYLSAFFQSVTLRTAGFNTINFAALNGYTYLMMILFMFIGAGSGSTAGGIKVNTVAVIFAYIRSMLKGQDDVVLFKQSIAKDLINKAFLIIFLFALSAFLSTLILTITEKFHLIQILFEVVSAIGTVGLSTGITAGLSEAGKLVIIFLMFIGRLGPLTIVSALSRRQRIYDIRYPNGNINIG
ncbi:MAG: TrkH family potassium uptake protein [Spirochaetes bacterium]|nr:TrkH family potassium uptake protein [Spirochaetota bacterium]